MLATTPNAHSLHEKYNTTVSRFEECDAWDDIAIVSGYKYAPSKAKAEWLRDRGFAAGYQQANDEGDEVVGA